MIARARSGLLLLDAAAGARLATSRTCCPSILLTSLGMGAVFMPLTLIATTGLDDDDQGLASGLFNTSQQIGGALGLAILSTLAASRTTAAGGYADCTRSSHGFHYAFAAGAVVHARRARRDARRCCAARHVARIEAEAASGEPAIVGALMTRPPRGRTAQPRPRARGRGRARSPSSART